jgi:hypothetical protein
MFKSKFIACYCISDDYLRVETVSPHFRCREICRLFYRELGRLEGIL